MRAPRALLYFALSLLVFPAGSSEAEAQSRAKIEVMPKIAHTTGVNSVAFSPNGKQVLSGGLDQTMKLWDAENGELLRTFYGHSRTVKAVAFSPDGSFYLSASTDKTIKLWDAASGLLLRTMEGHSDWILSVAFSPNGRSILSGGKDRKVLLWDTGTGQLLRALEGHTGAVNSVAFSPDGLRAISASADGSIKVWNVAQGEVLTTLASGGGAINAVAFAPNGTWIAAGDVRGTVTIWDVAKSQLLKTLEAHSKPVLSVAFSHGSSQILSGSSDNTLKLWNATTGDLLQTFQGHSGAVSSVAFSPDDGIAGSGSADHSIRLWDVQTGKTAKALEGRTTTVLQVTFSPDGSKFAAGYLGNIAAIWDAKTGQLLRVFHGHSGFVESVAFSPDGTRLVSASDDQTLKVWDASTGELIRTLTGHSAKIVWVSVSPDGKKALSASADKTAMLWDIETGKLLLTMEGHTDEVDSTAFSPDGKQALTGGKDATVRLWDTATGQLLDTLLGHTGAVQQAVFSSDGMYLLSGSSDGTARLWDAKSGHTLRTFSGHTGEVMAVAFSPDGVRIASGSDDGTVRLWDKTDGRAIAVLDKHGGGVYTVAYSPDGRHLLSAGSEGGIAIWDAQEAELRATVYAGVSDDWLAITPAGFFAASSKGADMVTIVRGFEVYSPLQFYHHLNRPDLIEESLRGDPEGKYTDAASGLNLETILNSGPAPQIELLKKKTELSTDSVKLAVRIKDASGGIGGKVVWRVNGKTQGDLTVPGLAGAPSIGRAVTMSQDLKVEPAKKNEIEITAYNASGALASLPFKVIVDPFGVTTEERPKLFVIAIGADKYAMKDYELHYSVKDAHAFAEAMKNVGSTLFSDVKITELADAQVTKDGIEGAITKISAEVRPSDVFVLFLAGHGRSIAGKYYFVQQDLDFAKGQTIERDGINIDFWQRWLAKIPAQKTLLVLDTCESAAAAGLVRGSQRERQAAMEQLQYATGQNLIAAARQAAHEGYRGHGVLTFTILEAFQKTGAVSDGGRVDVNGLASYVGYKVPEITESFYGVRQDPVERLAGNFPLGLRNLSQPDESECPASEDYIVIQRTALRQKPQDDAPDGMALDPGYKLGAKASGGWALVCRDGVKLGYVPNSSLLQTK